MYNLAQTISQLNVENTNFFVTELSDGVSMDLHRNIEKATWNITTISIYKNPTDSLIISQPRSHINLCYPTTYMVEADVVYINIDKNLIVPVPPPLPLSMQAQHNITTLQYAHNNVSSQTKCNNEALPFNGSLITANRFISIDSLMLRKLNEKGIIIPYAKVIATSSISKPELIIQVCPNIQFVLITSASLKAQPEEYFYHGMAILYNGRVLCCKSHKYYNELSQLPKNLLEKNILELFQKLPFQTNYKGASAMPKF
jgi:hypothetical protein